ncbi:MAG: glycoside hydrolase family 15 protein [Chryseolinea sp.]
MQKGYNPIENYGVIGDLNTVALVALDGSIDFMCFPNFDSPSIFAALLDKDKGGHFKIAPIEGDIRNKQIYLPDTNVLVTRFLSPSGVSEITDFMPIDGISNVLIRKLSCVRGSLNFQMECRPRFNYAQSDHQVEVANENEFTFVNRDVPDEKLRLISSVPMKQEGNDGISTFEVKAGEHVTFVLIYLNDQTSKIDSLSKFVEKNLFDTINFWKDWVAQSGYKGRWMEIINRSALALKLMISSKEGSLVASPTFGLPEEIGGIRNWDYRYTWIRDASFTIFTLLRLGYKKEAREFMNWVERQCKDIGEGGNLSLMYATDGHKELSEVELKHLSGYKNSKPVRIGNDAYKQLQLDIYGELLDAVYLFDKYAEPISYEFWNNISRQVDWVSRNWENEDQGIWEVRGGKKEFLYSRLMCWVALDRAIKIAQRRSYPLNENWRTQRDKIFHAIHHDFWNEALQSFVQFKGAETVDASTLLMPIVHFIGPTDPKWLSTLKKIEEQLVSDFLVYRYRVDEKLDGLTGGEGTFSMCTFWYVECLARAGQLNKARLYFEKMLGCANHVGLYSEMLGARGEHLGNFPQAFTHLGLITAALNLDHQFSDQRNKEMD